MYVDNFNNEYNNWNRRFTNYICTLTLSSPIGTKTLEKHHKFNKNYNGVNDAKPWLIKAVVVTLV